MTSEFFEQGDRERAELKLTPAVSEKVLSVTDCAVLLTKIFVVSIGQNDMKDPIHVIKGYFSLSLSLSQPIFDRNRKDELPALQLEWIDGICKPLYQVESLKITLLLKYRRGHRVLTDMSPPDAAEAQQEAAADG